MVPTYIILHCSDSAYGDASLIDGWHQARGWQGIGYHYVILNGYRVSSTAFEPDCDGIIEIGRREHVAGAHAAGMNTSSIGVCLIGKDGVFSRNQMGALFGLLLGIGHRHYIRTDNIIGHCETAHELARPEAQRKSCPDLDMVHIRATLDRMRAGFDREIMAWGG